ncbi:MAG: hypothetical protein RML72_09650 [Bacteroidia bacterium]|nr:hypothetical protein [Bacteroidia bacterium]MDW8159120.1 hypothetical protein [Bacteroidia bacterium]
MGKCLVILSGGRDRYYVFFLLCFFSLFCSEPYQSLYNQAHLLEARWNYCHDGMQKMISCLVKAQVICPQIKKEIKKLKGYSLTAFDTLGDVQQIYYRKAEKINNLHLAINKTYEGARKEKELFNEYLKNLQNGEYELQEGERLLSEFQAKLKKYENKMISYQRRLEQYAQEHDQFIDSLKLRFSNFNGDKIKCDIKPFHSI